MRWHLIFATLAACLSSATAQADVIVGPMTGYLGVDEIGVVEFGTTYKTPDGIPFTRDLGPEYGIVGHSVAWAPKITPISVEIGRDHQGAWLLLSSLLSDRQGRPACWQNEPIDTATAASKAALWRYVARKFTSWSVSCPVTRAMGTGLVAAEFTSARPDFLRGLKRLIALRRTKYLPQERSVGLDSFLPDRVSQPLLNAIADICGGARSRLQLAADGKIAFEFNPTLPLGADGTRPFDNCVNDHLRYMPGYKTAY